MSSLMKQDGGNILMDLQALAIPFSLLLAKNGLDYLQKKKDSVPSKKESKKKTTKKSSQKGGETMGSEVSELQRDMKSYLGGFRPF